MTTQIAEPVGTGRRPSERMTTRPRWVRPGLGAILGLAAVLYGIGVSEQTGNSYYSAAVMSGTKSWKAFFFGSLDAGSFITVDKPPLALWVQALVARVIGVNGWSLVGPSVVLGVAAVAVLYVTVRRAFGHVAALIAALVLALTPITVAINRDNNPDTLLVLLLVLGAWALQRALESGRLRWLLACAVFVGLGFNTKMLQAYLVLPAFALVYVAFARGGPLRRAGHLVAAGVVLAVSSFWWMVVVDLMPASSRPYIGGSADNTVWDLVIGYNGLGRIFGNEGNGGGPGGGRGGGFGGTAGVGRLFNEVMGGQISWLLPFAAIALVVAVALRGRAPRTDLARAALVLWGGWLAVHFLVFSLSEGTFHPYYTTAMAPAVAALVGAGTVAMFGAPRRLAWTLPVAVAVTGGWAFVLLRRTPSWHPWLAWTVLAVTAVAVVGLVVHAVGPAARRRLGVGAVVVSLVGVLAGPAAYAASAATSGATNGTNPTAGPGVASGPGGFGGPGGNARLARGEFRPPAGQFPGGAPGGVPGGQRPGGMGREGVSSQLIAYLRKNKGSATWLVAVSSAQSASSIILRTGQPVIAMGGFTGSDPAMTVAKLQAYVREGKVRYVMLGDDNRPGAASSAVAAWVKRNGTVVDASEYGGSSGAGSGGALYRLG